MNLILPEPPESSIRQLESTLTALAARGQFGARSLRNARPEQLSVTAPHAVHTVELRDLRDHPTLQSATATGWRYMIEIDEQVVASAETTGTGSGAHSFSHLNEGPFVEGTTRALSVAEHIGDDHDFEMRLLNIPALYFMGLWLSPTDGKAPDDDLIIPIAPTPAGIDANRSYPVDEMLQILSDKAESIPDLPADDARGG